MEGRTKYNYGMKNNILSLEDIDYMFQIINSESSEEEKAKRLYDFCNYYTIEYNLKKYNLLLLLSESEKLNQIKKVYEDYESKGLFESLKGSYMCTLEEIKLRLLKLNKAYDIINSNDNEYSKAIKLLSLYKNSEELRKTYSLFLKHGSTDNKLEIAREALNNFDEILTAFISLEKKGIIDDAKYVLSINNYFENYKYADFVIKYYINSSESYKEKIFLDELGIDKEVFEFCVETIELLNVDLFKQYKLKKEQNNKIRCMKNAVTITKLANEIKTGISSDGTAFDLLEFLKRVPFKNSKNFVHSIEDFMKRNNPQECNIIMGYIRRNRLHLPSAFKLLDIRAIYSIKTIVNGVEITNEDNNLIIEYLNINNIPLINSAYILVRKKYLNGEITKDMINEQKSKKININNKQKVLIPS